jgi:hypothetical protein
MRRPPKRHRAFQLLKTKLERGAAQAARGELLDADKVFDDLPDLIQQRSRMKKKPGHR